MQFDSAANPGIAGRARFLAGHAGLYSKHKWSTLSFQWIPSCANVTPGNVVLKFISNYTEVNPTAMIDLMDSGSQIVSPYQGAYYQPRVSLGHEYNNISATEFLKLQDADKGTYSIGRLVVAASKQVSPINLGMIRMHYNIGFQGPVSPPDPPAPST